MRPASPPTGFLVAMLRGVSDPLGASTEWSREGDVVRMPVPLPMRFLMVTHPDLIGQVLVKDHEAFRKDLFTRKLEDLLGAGLLTSHGAHWKRQRRLAQPAFHLDHIRGYASAMRDLTTEMLDSWPGYGRVDAHKEMMALTLRIASETLFGADVRGDAADIAAAVKVVTIAFMGIAGTGLEIPSSIPTRANRKKRAALRTIDRLVQRIIDDRRADPRPRTDLLSMLMAATDDEGNAMTDRSLRDEVVTLLLAGHETTAITLTITLFLLAEHPSVEARLHAEVDALDHAPGFDDLPMLQVCEQVIKESLRLYPPVWTIAREALRDLQLGEFAIRRGDQLWIRPWCVHRDARWFPNPLSFRPERWASESEQARPRLSYLPFGGGPRMCIGRRFALMESTLVLATIARRYVLRIEGNHRLSLLPSVTLRPRGGVPLHIARRGRHLS